MRTSLDVRVDVIENFHTHFGGVEKLRAFGS